MRDSFEMSFVLLLENIPGQKEFRNDIFSKSLLIQKTAFKISSKSSFLKLKDHIFLFLQVHLMLILNILEMAFNISLSKTYFFGSHFSSA